MLCQPNADAYTWRRLHDQGVLPLVAIEHIELEVEEDDGIDFWDPKGTFWDTRKTLFSNTIAAWESNKNWTPAEGGIKNAGTVGTFARSVHTLFVCLRWHVVCACVMWGRELRGGDCARRR